MEVITYGFLFVMQFATLEQCTTYAKVIYEVENVKYGDEKCFKQFHYYEEKPLPRRDIPLFYMKGEHL